MQQLDLEKLEKSVNEKAKEWIQEEIKRWLDEKAKLKECEICGKEATILIALCNECYEKWLQKKKYKNK